MKWFSILQIQKFFPVFIIFNFFSLFEYFLLNLSLISRSIFPQFPQFSAPLPLKIPQKNGTMSLETLLERLLETCSGLDEMPHSFDDTLIDKLVDSLEFEGQWLGDENKKIVFTFFKKKFFFRFPVVIRKFDKFFLSLKKNIF